MRILLDTNILISGLWVAGTPPARLIDGWRSFRYDLVTSQEQFRELEGVLARPKIIKRITPAQSERLLADLREAAVWATNLPVVDVSPDPDDNRILATAIAGDADLIVSGDQRGMRDLGEVNGITIVTAREAVAQLGLDDGA